MHGVSVIIPVFNNWDLTASCLRSLQAAPPEAEFEVLVVDNASSDATASLLTGFGADVFGERFRPLVNAENRNFAGACNQGAQAARHEHCFFLNNDTRLTQGWHAPLANRLEEEPGLGGIGPLLLYDDGTVQHLGAGVYPDRGIGHYYSRIPGTHALAKKRRTLRYITAAALLMRRDVFLETGGFCEEFINGLEDVDLCWRLGQGGYHVSVEPDSVIYHLEGQSRGREQTAPTGNVAVLDRRCPTFRQPEFHRIAAQDGYEPYFDMFFATLLRPTRERLERYSALLPTASAATLRAILGREIYWQEGWHRLAALLEAEPGAQGGAEAALACLLECSRFFPTPETISAAGICAGRSGRLDLAAESAASLARARALLEQPEFFHSKYERILATAEHLKDPLLLRMIRQWRSDFGPHVLPVLRPE